MACRRSASRRSPPIRHPCGCSSDGLGCAMLRCQAAARKADIQVDDVAVTQITESASPQLSLRRRMTETDLSQLTVGNRLPAGPWPLCAKCRVHRALPH